MNQEADRSNRDVTGTQSGQAAVLIALSMFTMVIFMALATNMGILVNDRIRMQNTADLTAYAGAFEQARALNRLTHINKRIYVTAYNMRTALTCPGYRVPDTGDIPDADPMECSETSPAGFLIKDRRVFPNLRCDPGGNAEDGDTIGHIITKVGQIKIQALAAAFLIENHRSNETSIRAARATADANFGGTGNPTHSSFYEFLPLSPTRRGSLLAQVEQVMTRFDWATFEVPRQCDCPAGSFFPPKLPEFCIQTYDLEIPTWFTKANPGPTVYFPARVNGVPAKDFLDIKSRRGGYFGADADRGPRGSDELWAFAVAKPFGGNLGPSDGQGDLKNIHFEVRIGPIKGSADVSDGGDYSSFDEVPGADDPMPYFGENYRARMAGIQDTMLLDKDGSTSSRAIQPIQLMMADLMRGSNAKPPIIKRFTIH